MALHYMTFNIADLISIEIGCLGHFMSDTLAQVASTSGVAKKTVRSLIEQAAGIVVSYSYRIFKSRASPCRLGSSGSPFFSFYILFNISVSLARAPVLTTLWLPVHGTPEARPLYVLDGYQI